MSAGPVSSGPDQRFKPGQHPNSRRTFGGRSAHPWAHSENARLAEMGARSRGESVEGADEPFKPAPLPPPKRQPREPKPTRPPRGQAAINAAKASCMLGHPYVGWNLYLAVDRAGHVKRRCKTCHRKHQRDRYVRKPPRQPGPRGQALLSLQSDTCKRGHPWDQYGYTRKSGASAGTRLCGECQRQRQRDKARLRRWAAQLTRLREADAERARFEREFAESRRRELAGLVSQRQASARLAASRPSSAQPPWPQVQPAR